MSAPKAGRRDTGVAPTGDAPDGRVWALFGWCQSGQHEACKHFGRTAVCSCDCHA